MRYVEMSPAVRWQKGMDHHPKTVKLYDFIQKLDFEVNDDYFCFKSGGDGDNGEALMYLMDAYFELQDAAAECEEFLEPGLKKAREICSKEIRDHYDAAQKTSLGSIRVWHEDRADAIEDIVTHIDELLNK